VIIVAFYVTLLLCFYERVQYIYIYIYIYILVVSRIKSLLKYTSLFIITRLKITSINKDNNCENYK